MNATDPAQIRVCSVVKGELFFGAALSTDAVKTWANPRLFLARFPCLPFDDAAAEVYAEIRADLTRRSRQLIGPNVLIAAICRANDMTVVTHNTAEFGRVFGLKIEDWEA